MKFSIIIPLFNNEKYIEQCILSVLNQNYDNYEIIIINDGSEDSGPDICKKFLSDNVRLINISNQGLSHARNVGIQNSTGDYILFLDSDDYYSCNFLSEINQILQNKKYDLIISKCNILNNVKVRRFLYDCEFDKKTMTSCSKEEMLNHLLDVKMKNVVWRYIVKKDTIINHNLLFNEKLKKFEDEEWTVKLLSYCNDYYYYDKPFYTYRVRAKSIMSSVQISDVPYYLMVISSLLKFSSNNEVAEYKNYVLNNCRRLLKYVTRIISKELGEKRTKRKKIILVGLGKAGFLHFNSYLKIKSMKKEDIILVDPHPRHEYFQSQEYFGDITSAMKYHNLDSKDIILDICTPKDCFKEIVDEAKELNIKNIIIEKPCMFTEKELNNYHDMNIVMIQNYMYSIITKKLKEFISNSTSKVIEIKTNFSKNRIADSKQFRGGINGKNVSVFEVEMPHQIYIVDYLLNKKEMGITDKIKIKDFYPGDAHAYGLIIDNYKNTKIMHLSNLCSEQTEKEITIKFSDGLLIMANYIYYDKNLNKEKNGMIEVYYNDKKIFSEIFEEDDNMLENIKYVYESFNDNIPLNNKEDILLNSSQIANYKEMIDKGRNDV